jgi:hypothetical protein
MKYIKPRYQFLNEAFESKAISKTLSFLDKECGRDAKDKFLEVIKKMKDNYDYPIDKIDDRFIKYTNKKEAIKIKFDGELHNGWGVYCLKFWFSLELGYIGYTATSNKIKQYREINKRRENEPFDSSELSHIRSKGITTGKLTPVVDYSLLKNRDKVVGCFAEYLDDDYITPATIIIDGGKIYAIQDVADGSNPSNRTGWEEFGRHSWNIGRLNVEIGSDHFKLHHYEFDNKPLRVEESEEVESIESKQSDNPLDWNLPVKKGNGRISDWKSDYSSIGDEEELEKADFSIILFFDDMINPDKAEYYERPSDISKEREESRKGALKLISDEEIKKVNIERYLNQIVSKIGVSIDKSDVKNLQKIIQTSLVGKYSFISILSNNYKGIDNFINYLYTFIKHSKDSKDIEDVRIKRDRDYYFKEVMDQYKTIYNRSLDLRKKYDNTYNWIIKNHSGDDEKSVLIIEILSKVIEIGNKIFDSISNQEANSIQEMRIIKSKLESFRNLLYEDVFLLPDRMSAIFRYFDDLSDVEYYFDRIDIINLKESKEKLEDIEKAVISILK